METADYQSIGQIIYGYARARNEFAMLLSSLCEIALHAPLTLDAELALIDTARLRVRAAGLGRQVVTDFDALLDCFRALQQIDALLRPVPPGGEGSAMLPYQRQLQTARKLLETCRHGLTPLL
ncbi:hypothetical protein GTP23_17925 [Pseudoduganella sp. FT93W]|uniref:Uncharacterized protein n=1 Tax=Duganella fentianensis TaxID=2692177 RepID=A0A845HZY6_9BURK|nr:hypothetical protein [Duganella fentianensis]MYN46924.1 hypothetical protein [Duganella fentianensis]